MVEEIVVEEVAVAAGMINIILVVCNIILMIETTFEVLVIWAAGAVTIIIRSTMMGIVSVSVIIACAIEVVVVHHNSPIESAKMTGGAAGVEAQGADRGGLDHDRDRDHGPEAEDRGHAHALDRMITIVVVEGGEGVEEMIMITVLVLVAMIMKVVQVIIVGILMKGGIVLAEVEVRAIVAPITDANSTIIMRAVEVIAGNF
mmetsp:Transcript_26287/g.39103  ORF Transcript_26287/g.39103 Transcript_26287/m.39103 type:complete len:202 (+) Transcript_26287:1408-2013(+)